MSVAEIIKEVIEEKLSLPYLVADLIEADKALNENEYEWPLVISGLTYPISFRQLKHGGLVEDHRIPFLVVTAMGEYDESPVFLQEKKDSLLPYMHRIFNQIRLHPDIRDKQQFVPALGEARLDKGLFSTHVIGLGFPITVPYQPDYCATDLIG